MIVFNEWKVETGKFPNGETWVNVRDQLTFRNLNHVQLYFENNDDLINLMFFKRFLDENGQKAQLNVMYFPYSRMDRRNDHYAFSLKYISEFINNLHFVQVSIMEVHSDVTPALVNNCKTWSFIETYLQSVLKKIDFDPEQDMLCFPDAGAVKRYGTKLQQPFCYGNKERDFKTGEIIKFELVVACKVRNLLIVDDLCSKGGTFLALATEAKRVLEKDSKIFLMVGHCERTIFDGELLKENSPIETVFTSNSLLQTVEFSNDKLEIISNF